MTETPTTALAPGTRVRIADGVVERMIPGYTDEYYVRLPSGRLGLVRSDDLTVIGPPIPPEPEDDGTFYTASGAPLTKWASGDWGVYSHQALPWAEAVEKWGPIQHLTPLEAS